MANNLTTLSGVIEDGTGNASNILVANPQVSGAAWIAPLSAEDVIDSVLTTLPKYFRSMGFLGEDGITFAEEDDNEDIKAFGGATVGTVFSSKTFTFTIPFLEYLNPVVKSFVSGQGNVEWETEGTRQKMVVAHDSRPRSRFQLVLDMMDGSLVEDSLTRFWLPNCMVTEVSERTFAHSAPTIIEATITAYPHPCSKKSVYEISERDLKNVPQYDCKI